MNRLLRAFLFISLCALILPLSGCRDQAAPKAPQPEWARFTRREMGIFDTEITLTGFAESQEAFDRTAEKALARLREYHQLFDAYSPYGEMHNLWYVNQYAAKGPVEVAPAFYDLLAWCREKWDAGFRQTNICMGSVLKIWHEYRTQGIADPEHARLPSLEALQRAAAHADFDSLILDGEKRTVYFADPEMQLDLGAVAKGYAADLVLPLLKEEMPSFLLSLGGNVYAGRPPLDGRENWNVGVQDPKASALQVSVGGTDILDVMEIHDLTAVTSGDYWRYYTVDGVRYHHIIDPDTLFPAQGMVSVTIICESSLLADYLSTALFILPQAEGRQMLEKIGNAEAMWVASDGSISFTDGMRAYSRMLKTAE
ncbi:MAG: FAD:protein FMN transferase [Clostridiales bacterium]|nr:FAD:protein FMN transferase [Clostridiales bacterium]